MIARIWRGWALALFDAQISNRHLDLAARYLRAASQGLYTIGTRGQRGGDRRPAPDRAGQKSASLSQESQAFVDSRAPEFSLSGRTRR
jgi:2-oxoisovalerate dehydrogenase E1 component